MVQAGWVKEHVDRYKNSEGAEGHLWDRASAEGNFPCLLLTTIGRKSGEPKTTPLISGRDQEDYTIIASQGGRPSHPAWYLNLVSNISTLIGLLGTIQGLIESFAAVAAADPTQKSELLTMGISKAMNTTYLGLVSAISMMVIHTYLSAKSDKIVNEIDEYSVKLLDFLGTSKQKPHKA